MKKIYNKPKVAVERFESSSAVALGCDNIIAVAELNCSLLGLTLADDPTAGCSAIIENNRYLAAYYVDVLSCVEEGQCYNAAEGPIYAAS